MGTIYGADLAFVQAAGFGGAAEAAAPNLLRLLARAGIGSGSLVVDLGCGAGVWLAAASRAGFKTAGCDLSAPLVTLARRAAPRASITNASVDDYRIPSCHAVTALGEVLGYRPPGRAMAELRRIARRVHASLAPGGLFLFDVMVTGAGKPMNYRTFATGQGWAVLVAVKEETNRRGLVREIVTFRQSGRRYRRSMELRRVTLFDPRQVAALLRTEGFAVRVRRGYDRDRLAPRRMAFIARKV